MHAITCTGYGAPDQVLHVTDVDELALAADAVLVEVHAAAVNPADWHLIRGVPHLARLQIGLRRPHFSVAGSDFAGRVVATGPAVTSLAVGDDVFGTTFMAGFGAFAERVAVPEALVTRKPDTVSFDEAAAVPLAALTALQALRDHGRLQPGQRGLIIGASGGVGTFAVQIARALGAHVTGVCSSTNLDLVRSLGADRVIDYTEPGAWDDRDRYDLVLQAGGTQSAGELRRRLEPGGTLVQISGESANRWIGPLGRVVTGRLLSAFVTQTVATFTVRPNRADLDHLSALLDVGSVRVVVDRAYPLDEASAAIAHVEAGHARGKVVLRAVVRARPSARAAHRAAPPRPSAR